MKANQLLLFFFLLLFTPLLLFPQWQEQLDIGLYTHLDRIFFINENSGWAIGGSSIGDNSPYFFTIDGGTNWDTTTPYGTDIIFVNENMGFIAAPNGVIYKTTDGGSNWTSIMTPATQDVMKLFFIDEDNGWATLGGDGNIGGKILHTIDSGDTWEIQEVFIADDGALNCIFFINQNNGWGGGWYFINGNGHSSFVVTEDSGNTWSEIADDYLLYNDIFFFDQNNGWVVGGLDNPFILHTIDGGDSWTGQTLPELNTWSGGTVNPGAVYSVQFINETDGWITCIDENGVVGNPEGNGYILITTDGGMTWQQQYVSNTPIYDTCIIDETHAWAVGAGKIYFNDDIYHIPIGVSDFENSTVNILPNPFYDTIKIQNSQNLEFEMLTISNGIGSIYFRSNEDSVKQIDLSYLPSGIYFITLKTKQGHYLTNKIIKL